MRFGVYVFGLLAPAAFGCASTVSTGPGDAEAIATTSAIVVVERTTDATGSRAEAIARFVRTTVKSSAEDALRVIGASLDLPAPGSCATIASLAGSATSGDVAPVLELVGMGSVSLEAEGAATRL